MVVHLFELGVLCRLFGVNLKSGLVASFHNFLAERPQLRTGRHQSLESGRILRVVLGLRIDVGQSGCSAHNALIMFGQFSELLLADQQMKRRAAFPPAGEMVNRSNLVEA